MGRTVLPCEYSKISIFSSNRAWIKREYNDNWACINEKGNIVFTIAKDSRPRPFSDGLCAVEKNGYIGYYSIDGKLIIPMKYKKGERSGSVWSPDFHQGTAIVSDGGDIGRIDKRGMFVKDDSLK